MNQSHKILTALALVLPVSVSAVDVFVGEVDDDYYYSDAVQVQGVVLPADLDSDVGSSTIDLTGTGTITVGANAGGGFPRISVVGGTTITSTRNFEGEVTKDWWDGTIRPPKKQRIPGFNDINGISDRHEITPVEAYKWGDPNEKFYYSISATVALPIRGEVDGQVFHVAELLDDGTWEAVDEMCVLQDGLCILEVNAARAITLYKINYFTCPVSSVDNGEVGEEPSCIVSCNIGYALGCDGKSCNPVDCQGPDCPALCGGFGFQYGADDPNFGGADNIQYTGNYKEFYQEALKRYKLKPSERRFQDLRYRGSNSDEHVYLYDETGLDEDQHKKVRKINKGKISRDLRGDLFEPLAEDAPRDKNSNMLDYILQVRNVFSGDKSTTYNEMIKPSEVEEVVEGEDELFDGEELAAEGGEGEEYYGSAPMLPSTGPSLFIIIAIIGVGLMVLGAFKRD